MNTIRTAAVALALLISPAALAQENASATTQRLEELNRQIIELGDTLKERAASYPEIIADIKARRAEIDRAENDVQQMIDDLKKLTDQMDADSEFYAELQGLEAQTEQLVAEAKAAGDKLGEQVVAQVQARLDLIKNIDERRADAIIEARAAIRLLEDNKERLVLIRKIGAIDAAIAIMEASVSDFEDIVIKAGAVAADVSTAVAGQ